MGNLDTLQEMHQIIRGLIEDFEKSDVEPFEYTTGDTIFILNENNIDEVTSVSINGIALESGQWSYADGEVTIADESGIISSGDIVSIKYIYYKYSDTELNGYILSALAYLNVIEEINYKIDSDDIYPTPSSRLENLICLIAGILIKPNYSQYRLPNLTVSYPTKLDKDEKIQRLIDRYFYSLGINDEEITLD